MTINRAVVSMTLKIKQQQLLRNTLRSCSVKGFVVDESFVRKYLTLSLKFLARLVNWTIIFRQKKSER